MDANFVIFVKAHNLMNVLIGCERSGIVRQAFEKRNHNAVSCDLFPSDIPGNHIQGDILEILDDYWDLFIGFPPCTYLAVSGARWFREREREREQKEAIKFFMKLINAPIEKIAIENPIGIMSTKYRKPDQIIQPWMFGHGETKATCLWLKNLPLLKPTNIVSGRENRIHKMAPSKNRGYLRSITYTGIAEALAEQYG